MTNFSSDIVVTYAHDIIHIKGKGITANVHMASSELKKMYWGSAGVGKVDVTIEETPPTANIIDSIY